MKHLNGFKTVVGLHWAGVLWIESGCIKDVGLSLHNSFFKPAVLVNYYFTNRILFNLHINCRINKFFKTAKSASRTIAQAILNFSLLNRFHRKYIDTFTEMHKNTEFILAKTFVRCDSRGKFFPIFKWREKVSGKTAINFVKW